MVLKSKDVYGLWQGYLPHFSKQTRHTLGKRIDDTCLNAIEYSFLASYSQKSEKVILIDRAISRVDLVKILLLLAWESKFLDTKKYTHNKYFPRRSRSYARGMETSADAKNSFHRERRKVRVTNTEETVVVAPAIVEPIEVELTPVVVVPQFRDVSIQVDLGDREPCISFHPFHHPLKL